MAPKTAIARKCGVSGIPRPNIVRQIGGNDGAAYRGLGCQAL